jgi:molybdopterin/thiamine biosynthesis adenylyltransferase
MTELSTEAQRRYARHLSLPEVGLAGQERLARASVLLIGAGGLGSPVALYLVAAGVGRLTLVDGDRVEASNLQRQVLYGERTLGARKVVAARERLSDLNPLVELEVHDERLVAANALALVTAHDVVVDGTDNFATRYLLSDACVLAGKPLVYGSIYRFEGQVTVFDARRGPCYRCLFPSPPPPELAPSCAEGGVLGVLPGIVGTLQATEALKLLLGVGEPLVGRLLAVDALGTHFGEYKVRKDPACPACGEHPSIHELVDLDPVTCATAAPLEAPAGMVQPASRWASSRARSRPCRVRRRGSCTAITASARDAAWA